MKWTVSNNKELSKSVQLKSPTLLYPEEINYQTFTWDKLIIKFNVQNL